MGTQIGDLLTKHEVKLESLEGKKLGFDGYNIIYQFLTTIRSVDGELLTNSNGDVTSHLIGMFHRLSNIMENGVKVCFALDGKRLELKNETVEKRKIIKIEAGKKAEQAEKDEDYGEMVKQKKRTTRITPEIVESTKEMLKAFNIPVIQAISDGEAQLSIMNKKGLLDGVVSQDFDTLVFGANDLYRNLTTSGKRKVPGKSYSINVLPEQINLEENLLNLEINPEKLIWITMLIGNDFNIKVPRVGPKTAIKLVKEHESYEDILETLNYSPEYDYRQIEDIFKNPSYNTDFNLEFKNPDFEKLKEILIEKYEFNKERIENVINKMEKTIITKQKQKKLEKWF
jgi:flap endonuclease-1